MKYLKLFENFGSKFFASDGGEIPSLLSLVNKIYWIIIYYEYDGEFHFKKVKLYHDIVYNTYSFIDLKGNIIGPRDTYGFSLPEIALRLNETSRKEYKSVIYFYDSFSKALYEFNKLKPNMYLILNNTIKTIDLQIEKYKDQIEHEVTSNIDMIKMGITKLKERKYKCKENLITLKNFNPETEK